jgi:hypothetical protein
VEKLMLNEIDEVKNLTSAQVKWNIHFDENFIVKRERVCNVNIKLGGSHLFQEMDREKCFNCEVTTSSTFVISGSSTNRHWRR